jgi:hypothetical protein
MGGGGGGSMQQVTVDMKDADVWTVLEKILGGHHKHGGHGSLSNGNMLQPQKPPSSGFLMS